MGGLVAENASNATITASYSLGAQTSTKESAGTENKGGFAGSNAGTITDSYWDATTSGIGDDLDSNSPEGKTTSDLQQPREALKTGSGATATYPTGIYANWNVNVDGTAGNDDPWDFGGTREYPALDFGSHVLNKQRNVGEIRPSDLIIWERADTGLSRVNASTITVTLDHAWEDDVTVAMPTAVAGLYTLSATNISHPRRLHLGNGDVDGGGRHNQPGPRLPHRFPLRHEDRLPRHQTGLPALLGGNNHHQRR